MKTRITELLGTRYPIVQGGLQHLALPGLCAAVSNAGGLGQLTAAAFPTPDQLREGIEETRALTDRPFGVNVVIGRRPLEEHLVAALEAGVRIFTFTGGNPQSYFELSSGRDVCRVVMVAAVKQAKKAESMGADAVIAVGHEGGGNIGRDDVSTLVLIPRVADALRIPVIAGGGISDARGFGAALALGAEGVEMGTRFIATRECLAHPAYKQALVDAAETDTVVIRRSIGRPGRALRGPWVERILECEGGGGSREDLLPMISGEVNWRGVREGDFERGYVMSGQGVGLIDDVPTCGELIDRMVRGVSTIGHRLVEVFV